MSTLCRSAFGFLSLCGLLSPSALDADPLRFHRARINRFAGTFSLGATVGVGSPLGLAGVFVEARPVRALSLGVGGGVGGAFGPSVGATMYLSPFSTRVWSPQFGASFSHNVSYVRGEMVPGRGSLPGSTDWVGVEFASEFRPSRNLLVRIGFGRAFLLGTSAFNVASSAEIANLPSEVQSIPGATPLDAVRAAALGDTLGVWFFHIDIAPTWRF